MSQRDEKALIKIVSETDFLAEALEGVSAGEFNGNELLKLAAAMSSINIGELAKRLSNDFHEDYPDNELRMAAKTRDV